jgi:hypothetical protein
MVAAFHRYFEPVLDGPGLRDWAAKAENARAEAERATDPEAKRLLLKVADNYAEIARARGSWETGGIDRNKL